MIQPSALAGTPGFREPFSVQYLMCAGINNERGLDSQALFIEVTLISTNFII